MRFLTYFIASVCEMIQCDGDKSNVYNVCGYWLPTVSSLCVTGGGLCELTVTADKRATVQSTVVTKTCSSLISCATNPRTIRLARLGMWCCDLESCEKIGWPSPVDYLYDIIGQSDVLSFYGTRNTTCLGHTGLSGTKKRRRRSARAVMPNFFFS